MDEQLSKLKEQLARVEGLKHVASWGPEYQLWEKKTENLTEAVFGQPGLALFRGQKNVTFSYIDDDYNRRQYLLELDNRRRILEGLFAELAESSPAQHSGASTDKDILKEIWRNEQALKENLLKTTEAEKLHLALLAHLEKVLLPDSLPGLRFRKLKAGRIVQTWWSTATGYPTDNPWGKFQPLLDLLEQHEAERAIKMRLETEGLFVVSQSKGEDQHLLIGKKAGSGEKAHVIIDGKTGEIRVEDNQQEPTGLVPRIETLLSLPDGTRIKTTREMIEKIA